jgi:hypothetical protein
MRRITPESQTSSLPALEKQSVTDRKRPREPSETGVSQHGFKVVDRLEGKIGVLK